MKKPYTVIAVYVDDLEARYATCVEAESPAEAEELAQRQCFVDNGGNHEDYSRKDQPLIVAGVIEGDHVAVDAQDG